MIDSLINVNKKTSLRIEVKKLLLNEVLFEKVLLEAKKLLLNMNINKVIYC